MSTILQDMMGMLKKKGTVVPKADNYMTVARYPNPQERLKPRPTLQTELVTLSQLKTFFNAGGGDKQQLSIAGQSLSLTNGGSVTLPDEYVNAATFDGATDRITLSRVGGTTISVDMNRKDTKEFVNFTALTVDTGATTVLNTNSPGQIFVIRRAGVDGTGTLQLPPAAGTENWQYRKITITTDGSTTAAKPLTLDAQGAERINGGANFVLERPYATVTIWSDGSNWIVLSSSEVVI